MKLDKISIDGKKDSIEVLDKIFSAKINHKLVSAVLYKTNANYKGRHAKTKQQNEVKGPTSIKKELVVQGMLVEKLLYLLVEVLLMDQKVN